MARLIAAISTCVCMLLLAPLDARAADEKWFEMKSPHFTVWSNASDGNARTLVWQLEQIRSAMTVMWPWARVDLAKPLLVIAVKDESGMRALAPRYWEEKGNIRPASVWVSGADQHYIVIRTDVRGDDKLTLNPHISAYFSYATVVLQASFGRNVPPWFLRGLAGVLSNTLVRSDYIGIGAPIPWLLETVRDRRPLPLASLLAIARNAPELQQSDELARFNAQSWAFVHYLMFGDDGAHQARINRLAALLVSGKPGGEAVAEALGPIEDFDRPFGNYIDRHLFSYQKARVDATVARERFEARPMSPAESSAGRAAFHLAMRRPDEARALLEQARKANPSEPGIYVAEGLQADAEERRDDARRAYLKAAELGSPRAYGHYRAAVLHWPRPDAAALELMEKHLARAVELAPSFAPAYVNLAEVRAWLKRSSADIMAMLTAGVKLEPRELQHRLAAVRILMRLGSPEAARQTAEAALPLADTDEERAEVQRLLASIGK